MNAAKANSSIGPLEPVIFWSTLARAVVGGIFGLIVYLVYLLYTQPYFLSGSQPENLLVAGGNGFLVGIFIFSLGRWLGSNPGIALRIISAIVFSFFTMASYLYLAGFYGDRRQFLIDVAKVAITLGGGAGAFAKVKVRRTGS